MRQAFLGGGDTPSEEDGAARAARGERGKLPWWGRGHVD